MAGPNDGPWVKTYQYTLASFGDAATGWDSEPGFDAAPEAESADGRSASAARGSYNLGTFGSQVSFSLQHNKPKRHRIKARSRILKFCSSYRSWANLELCYSKWGEIPECYERFLLQLAEDLDVAEDSNNLEGWTIQQMLSHVSGGAYVGSNVILQAIRDIRARHQNRSPLVVSVRISNVTKEVADWIKSSEDHILLVQETHLGPAQARLPDVWGDFASHGQRYQRRCSSADQAPHPRQGRAFSPGRWMWVEAVDVRLQRTNLLVASVYLKTGTSIHTRPNSSILAELLSLVKNWKGMWIIAGDFNTPPEELAATNVLAEMNRCLCKVGVPTTDQGREIDFAIVHKALEPLSRLRIDWAVPHKPHASLTLRLDMGEGLCPAMMLEQHSQLIEGGQAEQGDHSNMASKPLLEKSFQGEWLQNTLPQDAATQHFALVSEACSACVEPTHPSDRGTTLRIVRRPLIQHTAPQTKRTAKCSWARALSWLRAAQKGEQSRHSWQTVADWIHNLPKWMELKTQRGLSSSWLSFSPLVRGMPSR